MAQIYKITARASSALPETLRNSEGIRQALAAVHEYFPLDDVQLTDHDLDRLCEASRTLARRIAGRGHIDVALRFTDLCDISSDLFKEVKDIRKAIKDLLGEYEDELEENCVGALRYVSGFRNEMVPALANSILLRRFANFVDAVLLAQIRHSDENVEIELHLVELAS
ncbi:hypothetical protein R0381_000269 [Jeongeupia wiesaeckerbachi]|uniref:hypothetical protein n=1 Tax=Jeongeupia wiesaeckerbachi TaxID=3051218 RepID=UPI003D808FE6